jgi:hypothetical protein
MRSISVAVSVVVDCGEFGGGMMVPVWTGVGLLRLVVAVAVICTDSGGGEDLMYKTLPGVAGRLLRVVTVVIVVGQAPCAENVTVVGIVVVGMRRDILLRTLTTWSLSGLERCLGTLCCGRDAWNWRIKVVRLRFEEGSDVREF